MRRYPRELDAVIWALMQEGIGTTEILARLAEDRAGLGYPITMPRSTLQHRKRRLMRTRGDPGFVVDAGQELDAAAAIERRTLEALGRRMAELEAEQNAGKALGLAEIKQLAEIGKVASAIRRRAHVRAEQAKHPAKQRAGRDTQSAKAGRTETLLERLAMDIAREGAQEGAEPITDGDVTGGAVADQELGEQAA
jgi:hypothetical protein